MQGHFIATEQRREDTALWVSYLLSASTGTAVTPEQLLGTEEDALAAKVEEGNAKIEALQERMKQLPVVQYEVAGAYDAEA